MSVGFLETSSSYLILTKEKLINASGSACTSLLEAETIVLKEKAVFYPADGNGKAGAPAEPVLRGTPFLAPGPRPPAALLSGAT